MGGLLKTYKKFMNRMNQLGYSAEETKQWLHKQISILPNAKHNDVHSKGWNKDWKKWVNKYPKFTKKQMMQKIKKMMKQYNIPKNSRTHKSYKKK